MKKLYYLIVFLPLLNSCGINSDIMFKTPKDYEFDVPEEVSDAEYKLAPRDVIQFRLYANNGFMIIDLASLGIGSESGGQRANNNSTLDISYYIKDDGYVKLPTILEVKLSGMTVFEAEDFLEKAYSKYYVDPFIILRVNNRRVIVSTGGGGTAKVVELKNTNTRLIEALAEAGGIVDRGKAKEIKLIRNMDGKQEIYEFDLSKIEGIEGANMIVQANDIIYVTPKPQVATGVLKEITPFLAIITSLAAVYAIILAVK